MWRFLRNGKEIVSFYWNHLSVQRIYKNGKIVWEAFKRIAIKAVGALKSSHSARAFEFIVKTMRGTQQKVKSNIEASLDRSNIGSFSFKGAVKSATTSFLTHIGIAKPKVDDRISSTVTSSAEQICKGSMGYESHLRTAGQRTANPLEVHDAEAIMESRTAGERTAYSTEAFDMSGKQDSVFYSAVTADRFLPGNVIAMGEAQSSADVHGTAFSPKEISCGIVSESDFVASVKKFIAVGVRSETHEYSAGQGRISKISTPSAMFERDYSDYSASILSFLPKQIKTLVCGDSCEFKTVATAGTGKGMSMLTESTFKSYATVKSKEVMEDAWAVQTGDSLHVFQVLNSEQDGEILYLLELEDWAVQTEQTLSIVTAYNTVQNNEELEVK